MKAATFLLAEDIKYSPDEASLAEDIKYSPDEASLAEDIKYSPDEAAPLLSKYNFAQ
ncbi:uncharacterized protein PGTG_20587 [Puccinia graminis f. sp. tritici CRL 75-36-700-3]|uniref:Uncharacterized protein n=1 Tax=Puccinia graminis f. sp. tritici (strain CRL 75-36-700-3 / race SCCL) TaxID=418459 RepID=H6QNY3_PUCGT|nr:uncharacterized protein PGTG_20587 [Puccinia graminis f. sp. tritici CRL 75-36-700-3]EHS62462.1 hypothetical protein PGTG_20587 [Puccinia graminis f. sp. tritici CRL 75-36-700-3]